MKALLTLLLLLHTRQAIHNSTIATSPCPSVATIDRIEGDTVVLVLGTHGVRTIASSAIVRPADRALREGMTVRRVGPNRCELQDESPRLRQSVRARLRALSEGRPQN